MLSAVLISAVLAGSGPASRDEAVSALLLRKTQIFSDAGQVGDGAAMARQLDDRVIFVNEGGERSSKAEMAKGGAGAQTGVTSRIKVTDWHCEVHGDVAVTSFVDDLRSDWHGQPFNARYRSVETWLESGGEWRMIASETIALRDDPPGVSLSASTLDEYVGTFEAAPGVRFVFTHGRDGLYASTAGGAPTLQRAEVRDLFFTPGRSQFTKVFERDAGGRVVGFVLRREGHDIRFRRV